MNTMEAIKARKSVRSYLNKAVEEDKIRSIVEAGAMAAGTPMAGKIYFSVITNPQLLTKITEGAKGVMSKSGVDMLVKLSSNPGFNPMYGAPVAVVISTDKAADPNSQNMTVANAACAGENMLIAATDSGLASCYLVSPTLAFAIPEIKAAAKIPENAVPQAMIVFGYSEDNKPHAPKSFDNIVYVK